MRIFDKVQQVSTASLAVAIVFGFPESCGADERWKFVEQIETAIDSNTYPDSPEEENKFLESLYMGCLQ
jgi:hypothetical protein